ncbi:MAG: lytic murein transglycosylase [Rhodospirillales bacterium]|jgi:membrane-bound lytic murein transglycosylase B|nr:lytic murein transglycosylase [Rhodospirillales bacterium]
MTIPARLSTFLFTAILITGLSTVAQAATIPPPPPFDEWLAELRDEAISKGLNSDIVDLALKDAKPIARVLELDRRQPEFTLTFWKYLSNAISDKRIKRGRELLAEHGPLLEQVAKKFGVQPRFLVAFWGLETNFGQYFGKIPVVGSLVTLAHDRRRAKFFRAQLLAALELMSKGDMPVDVGGSWAGAMGNFQFIPTTYRDFAVDGDGDGKRDLWNNLSDAFSSAANYLSKSGWNIDRTWGREIKLPKGFDLALIDPKIKKSLKEWQALGVRRADGRNLPVVAIEGSLVLPAGHKGPAFIIYSNFNSIMTWNRSTFYAIAIGHLADRFMGQGGVLTPPPVNEIALSRDNVIEIQNLLTAKGFDTNGVDGMIGPMTRKAVRSFQAKVGIPADGYPSMELLEKLRKY